MKTLIKRIYFPREFTKKDIHKLEVMVSLEVQFYSKKVRRKTELCYLETQPAIVSAESNEDSLQYGHIHWFHEKGNQSAPWNKIFLYEILRTSQLGEVVSKKREMMNQPHLIAPYQCYIKFLQDFCGKIIDTHTDNIYPVAPSFKKLEYQLHAVNNVLEFMYRHNGCILADIVGLGKTIIAVMVIKRFLCREGFIKGYSL